jgi:hypothetical protein
MWPALSPELDLDGILHEVAKRRNAFQQRAGEDQSSQQVTLSHGLTDAED